MKKYLLGLGLSTMLVLAACGSTETDDAAAESTESKDTETTEDTVKGVVAPEDFDKMYSDPLSYEGYEVEFTGQVFTEPEKDADGTYLQVYAKPTDLEQNVLVGITNPDLEVSTNDYVSIKGMVKDQYEGENMMGGTIVAPVIEASSIEIVDYITAVSPTIKTIDVNQEIDQHGFLVTLQKIEIAENQTRVYVKVTNNSSDAISYFSSSTKLIVDNKQYEEEYVYDSGLPEVQSDILAGVETEGVITFPAIDPNTTALKFHSEGYSDNYELNIEPFVFEVVAE